MVKDDIHKYEEVEEKPDMEVILVVVLVLMLVALGYAQHHRGVVRTVGKFNLDEDEKKTTTHLNPYTLLFPPEDYWRNNTTHLPDIRQVCSFSPLLQQLDIYSKSMYSSYT